MLQVSVQGSKNINWTQINCLDYISYQYQRFMSSYYVWWVNVLLRVMRNSCVLTKRALCCSRCKSYCVKCGYIHNLCWVCVTEPPTLPGESFCGLSLRCQAWQSLPELWWDVERRKGDVCSRSYHSARNYGSGGRWGGGAVSHTGLLSFLSDFVHHTSFTCLDTMM